MAEDGSLPFSIRSIDSASILSNDDSGIFVPLDEEEIEVNKAIQEMETVVAMKKKELKDFKKTYLARLTAEHDRIDNELQQFSENKRDTDYVPVTVLSVRPNNRLEHETEVDKMRTAGFATLAAATGDIVTLQRMNGEGKDLSHGDYDRRTPIQLAVAEGQIECVQFLLECNVDCSAKDRWGCTVLEDARRSSHSNKDKIFDMLKRYITNQVVDPIAAASQGDLDRLRQMSEEGMNMNCHNNDDRTPLHLACVEGHSDVVRFLLDECGVKWDSRDRWGRTPFQDAKNYRHGNVLTVFRNFFEANNVAPGLDIEYKNLKTV